MANDDTGTGGAPVLDPRAMAQALISATPQDKANQPFVPLWKVKPAATPRTRGSLNKLDAMDEALGESSPGSKSAPNTTDYHTADYADSAFLDMSPDDQKEFRDKAIKAGLIKDDATPSQIIQAWQNAVSQAEKYNKSRPDDKDKWISPFEAVEKLGINAAAENGAAWNGFSRNVQSKMYSESEVKGNAISVLQKELGRDPTDAEVRAFTVAINHASALNPVVTTSTPLDANGNPATSPDGVVTTLQSQSGGIDPNQILLDQVRSSPEHAAYDAAATFYPAILQALDSIA